MKHLLFCILAFFMLNSTLVFGQGSEILGLTSAEEIKTEHRLFEIYANRYQPDSAAIAFLHSFAEPVHIKILFGTWCHDSKREVPAFMKIMELIDNPHFETEYIGVTKAKKDPEGRTVHLTLERTPTFIIYLNKKEIGRIIENQLHL